MADMLNTLCSLVRRFLSTTTTSPGTTLAHKTDRRQNIVDDLILAPTAPPGSFLLYQASFLSSPQLHASLGNNSTKKF